jgi:uncharacterized protein (DUF779 family)
MCFPAGELRVRESDVYLGDVAGCPFYVDAEQYERWGSPEFVLDVGAGAGSGFSLEGLDDLHFRVVGMQVGALGELAAIARGEAGTRIADEAFFAAA